MPWKNEKQMLYLTRHEEISYISRELSPNMAWKSDFIEPFAVSIFHFNSLEFYVSYLVPFLRYRYFILDLLWAWLFHES